MFYQNQANEANNLTHHKWTKDDDIIALYLYKFDDIGLPFSLEQSGRYSRNPS
jgi:hypothetical protein